MRALLVGEHDCQANGCADGRCKYAGQCDLIISINTTVVVCSTLEPDFAIAKITVCVLNAKAEKLLQNLEGHWETAELFPRKSFIFELADCSQVISLLQSQIPNIEILGCNC